MQTIKIILLALPLLYELIKESRDFIVLKKPDNHVKSTWIRILLMVVVSLVVAIFHREYGYLVGVFQSFLYSAGLFMLFDPLLNLIRRYIGKQMHVHFFYYGQSFTDKFWKKWPPYVQIFIRLWVYGVCHGVFFNMNKIISYYG